MRLTIADQYFEFTPRTSHRATCSRAGTNLWEVSSLHRTRLRSEGGGDYVETVTRMVCTECGVVHLDTASGASSEMTDTLEIGYGSKPQRCAGLWLHPGPIYRHRDATDPETYYVTGSPERPASREDVIGIIGWTRPFNGSKFGAPRWWAGLGIGQHGSASSLAPETLKLKSKTAAAKWVAEQWAAALSEAAQTTGVDVPTVPGAVLK